MRRVLAADAAELLQLQPLRHSLPILGGRIVPLFALATLHCDDLSGHCSLRRSAGVPPATYVYVARAPSPAYLRG